MMILSWANVGYYQELMQGIRLALAEDRFPDFYEETKALWRRGDASSHEVK
jgi:queuine tRNA-ribosyltransferase